MGLDETRSERPMELDEITGVIVDTAIRIHRDLGPGLLESVYEMVLFAALTRRELRVERQRAISFSYEGLDFIHGFRADLIVEKRVIIEVKSVERFAPVHGKQLLTYLRLTNLRVGLLLNFGADTMKEGLKRVVNDLDPAESSRLRVNATANPSAPRLFPVDRSPDTSAPPRLRVNDESS